MTQQQEAGRSKCLLILQPHSYPSSAKPKGEQPTRGSLVCGFPALLSLEQSHVFGVERQSLDDRPTQPIGQRVPPCPSCGSDPELRFQGVVVSNLASGSHGAGCAFRREGRA